MVAFEYEGDRAHSTRRCMATGCTSERPLPTCHLVIDQWTVQSGWEQTVGTAVPPSPSHSLQCRSLLRYSLSQRIRWIAS